jgi:lipopolysaccharide export system protein LptA
MFKLAYLSLISTFFNCLYAISHSSDFQSNSFVSEPLFRYSDSDQNISLAGQSATLIDRYEYLVENPKLEIKTDKFSTNINAHKAEFNRKSKFINFMNSVTFNTFFEKEVLIESEKLSFDINQRKLVSDLPVFASMNDVSVNSLGIEILQLQEGLKAEFFKGEIKIKIKENYHLGSADKVTIHSTLNELIMNGNAYFNQDGFIIKSDTIHYDLEERKIIKSLNSRIENSL